MPLVRAQPAHLPPKKIKCLAPALANGPRQAGLNGRDVLVQIVAIQAQSSLFGERQASTRVLLPYQSHLATWCR